MIIPSTLKHGYFFDVHPILAQMCGVGLCAFYCPLAIDSVVTLSFFSKLPLSSSNPSSLLSQYRADGPKRMGWD